MAIRTGGPGDSILLEDARDLGEWEATPPAVMGDDKIIFLPRIPRLADWLALAAEESDDGGGMSGMLGPVGSLLAMEG